MKLLHYFAGFIFFIKIDTSCSVITARKIPLKLKDLGSFTIPMEIGSKHFSKALCDLGANINLMPLSMYLKLGLGG